MDVEEEVVGQSDPTADGGDAVDDVGGGGSSFIDSILSFDWMSWIHVAGTVAAVTAISILTVEKALGAVRLTHLLAYGAGSSMLIGLLLIIIIAMHWGGSKIPSGPWIWPYWLLIIPIGLLYYAVIIILVYTNFVQMALALFQKAWETVPPPT